MELQEVTNPPRQLVRDPHTGLAWITFDKEVAALRGSSRPQFGHRFCKIGQNHGIYEPIQNQSKDNYIYQHSLFVLNTPQHILGSADTLLLFLIQNFEYEIGSKTQVYPRATWHSIPSTAARCQSSGKHQQQHKAKGCADVHLPAVGHLSSKQFLLVPFLSQKPRSIHTARLQALSKDTIM